MAGVVTLANQKQFTWPNSTGAQSVTINATTIGNLIVIAFGRATSSITITPSGGGVTTWTRVVNLTTNPSHDVWAGLATSSVTSVTVTASTGNTGCKLEIGEFASTTGFIAGTDDQSNTSGGVSQTVTTASITPTADDSLVIAMHARISRTLNVSPSSPWSNLTESAGAVNMAWQQQGTAAAITATWTLNVGTSTYNTIICNFLIVAAAPFVVQENAVLIPQSVNRASYF